MPIDFSTKRWSIPIEDLIGQTIINAQLGCDEAGLYFIKLLTNDGTVLRFTADYEDWGDRASSAYIESNKFDGKRYVSDLEEELTGDHRHTLDGKVISMPKNMLSSAESARRAVIGGELAREMSKNTPRVEMGEAAARVIHERTHEAFQRFFTLHPQNTHPQSTPTDNQREEDNSDATDIE